MKLLNSFPLERLDEVQAKPADFALLQRVPLVEGRVFGPTVGDEIPILFLDVETTGLDPAVDRIVELGIVRALHSPSARTVQGVEFVFSEFEDPGFPIPAELTAIHGITDEMVSGEQIGDMSDLFADDPIIVAHNAGFDRPFFDRRFPEFHGLRWADSCRSLDWRSWGYEGAGLKALQLQAGFFFDGHRAADDCLALAWLMHVEPRAFAQVLAQADSRNYVVEAQGSPFEVKDILSKRGYRWRPERKVWFHESVVDLDAELEFLDRLYPNARRRAIVRQVTARERFKKAGLPPLKVDSGVIAVGNGERKPTLSREQMVERIGALEDRLIDESGMLPELWFDENRRVALGAHLRTYGPGPSEPFGPDGNPDKWSDQQLRNWLRYLEQRAKASDELSEAKETAGRG